jgi:hypothetical protein
VRLMAADQAPGDDHEEQRREEDGDRGDDRSGHAEDEVAGEGCHDHNGAWADQAHGDSVYELPLGKPVMIVNESLM